MPYSSDSWNLCLSVIESPLPMLIHLDLQHTLETVKVANKYLQSVHQDRFVYGKKKKNIDILSSLQILAIPVAIKAFNL